MAARGCGGVTKGGEEVEIAGISRAVMWPRALLQVVPTGAGNEEFRPIPEKPFENCSQAIHMLADNVLYIEFVNARPLIKGFSDFHFDSI